MLSIVTGTYWLPDVLPVGNFSFRFVGWCQIQVCDVFSRARGGCWLAGTRCNLEEVEEDKERGCILNSDHSFLPPFFEKPSGMTDLDHFSRHP